MANIVTMRALFASLVLEEMKKDERIWVLTGDLGFGMWDEVRDMFPERFINTGAAEQALIGLGVGLALEHKIPIVYSITPFLLYRPFETIRNYLHHESIPVKLVGSGRNHDYENEGFSHWATEDQDVLFILDGITGIWPNTEAELREVFTSFLYSASPSYLNLPRKPHAVTK